MINKELTPEEIALQLKRQYQNQWRKQNRDKVRGYEKNYWLRKAKEVLEKTKDPIVF